jgi:hypothetical protein
MMKVQLKTIALLAFSLTLFLFSCSSENTARVEVRLTDSPGDYEEVKIDIQGVQVNNSAGNSGWVSLDIEEGIYDILQLTNGIDTVLGAIELPAGRIEQIRLILGPNNSIKVDGQTFSLSTPSAQQSGLKLNLHADLTEGITYIILLDFDCARSIVVHGNGTYSLKPVIRALEEATSGAIKGAVTPVDATPAVYAISGTDTVGTAFADDTGKFLLRGIPAGTYLVSLVPSEAYEPVVKDGVVVSVGNVNDIGTIEF